MNLPLDFNSAEPWTRIVKIALTIAAVYAIAVVGLFVKGNLLGGAVLLVFGLAFYAVLRRARRVSMGAAGRLTASAVTVHPVRVWGFSLNVPSGAFSLDRFQPSAWRSTSSSIGQWGSRKTAGSCSSWGALGPPTSKS